MFLDNRLSNVKCEQEPHESHVMTEWQSTICQLANADRFGRRRICTICEGEDYLCGGAGSRWQDTWLGDPCVDENGVCRSEYKKEETK